jgi:hypothetical protein
MAGPPPRTGSSTVITFTRPGPRIGPADISRAEQLAGHPLPDEYVRYLLQHNGGGVEPRGFLFDHISMGKTQSWVEDLFPVAVTKQGRVSLEWAINNVRNRQSSEGPIPIESIPIGAAASGDLVLFLAGPRRGEVWLKNWDDCGREDAEDAMLGMYSIAPSFERLIDGLSPVVPP